MIRNRDPFKTAKGKKDELKATAPQLKHYKQKSNGQFLSHKNDQTAIQNNVYKKKTCIRLWPYLRMTVMASFEFSVVSPASASWFAV